MDCDVAVLCLMWLCSACLQACIYNRAFRQAEEQERGNRLVGTAGRTERRAPRAVLRHQCMNQLQRHTTHPDRHGPGWWTCCIDQWPCADCSKSPVELHAPANQADCWSCWSFMLPAHLAELVYQLWLPDNSYFAFQTACLPLLLDRS